MTPASRKSPASCSGVSSMRRRPAPAGSVAACYNGRVVQRLILHAMRALYPRTDALPGLEDTDDDAFLARYRREASPLLWLGLGVAALVFAATPLLTVYVPLPSFLLPRRLLDRHAHRVTYLPVYLLRQAVFLLKLTAGLCWASHPAVRGQMAMAPYPADPDGWRTS